MPSLATSAASFVTAVGFPPTSATAAAASPDAPPVPSFGPLNTRMAMEGAGQAGVGGAAGMGTAGSVPRSGSGAMPEAGTPKRRVHWLAKFRTSGASDKAGMDVETMSYTSARSASSAAASLTQQRGERPASPADTGRRLSGERQEGGRAAKADPTAARLATVLEMHEALLQTRRIVEDSEEDDEAHLLAPGVMISADHGARARDGGTHAAPTATSPRSEMQLVQVIQQMERHLRKSRLAVPITDQLARQTLSSASLASGDKADKDKAATPGGAMADGVRITGGGDEGLETEGQRLGLYLFVHITGDLDRKHLLQEDLEAFLPPKDAARAFALFDKDNTGQVSLQEMQQAVGAMLEERHALAAALRGSKTIVSQVAQVITVAIHVIFLFIYLLVFGYNLNESWVAISGVVLGFSFVFASYLSNIFTCAMWLLNVKPFENGDVILINDEYHTVEECRLQHTQLRTSNGELLWYPNGKMVQEPVSNLTRSSEMWEGVKALVDLAAPVQRLLDEARARLPGWFAEEPQAAEFTGKFNITMSGIRDPMKAQISFTFQLSHSGVDLRRTALARSTIYTWLGALILEVCGQYGGYTLPTMPPWQQAQSSRGIHAGGNIRNQGAMQMPVQFGSSGSDGGSGVDGGSSSSSRGDGGVYEGRGPAGADGGRGSGSGLAGHGGAGITGPGSSAQMRRRKRHGPAAAEGTGTGAGVGGNGGRSTGVGGDQQRQAQELVAAAMVAPGAAMPGMTSPWRPPAAR